MALLMMLAMAACGSQNNDAQTASTGTQEAAASGIPSTTELKPVTLDWYIGAHLGNDEDVKTVNNALNTYIKPLINATVTIHQFTSWDEVDQKLPVLLSSGSDVGIVGTQRGKYGTFASQGSFYELDDLLDKYASDTKALFNDQIWKGMKVNDHIYGIPCLKDNAYIIPTNWNVDLAEKLGIKDQLPTTGIRSAADLEDFLTMAKEKRDKVLGTDIKDPLAVGFDDIMPVWFALEQFSGLPQGVVCNIPEIDDITGKDDNTIFDLYETPQFKKMAKSMARMGEKGILDYSNTDVDYKNSITAGDWAWGLTYTGDGKWMSDDTNFQIYDPSRYWIDTNAIQTAYSAVSANCKNPERAMMLLNLANTDPKVATLMRFGVEGVHYALDANGKMIFTGVPRPSTDPKNPTYRAWYGAAIGNLMITQAPESLAGPDNVFLTKMKEDNQKASIASHLGFTVNTDPIANQIAACANVESQYLTALAKAQLKESKVDSYIDEFVGKLKSNGMDDIIKEIQKQADAWKASNK